jgi:hypothetical protein
VPDGRPTAADISANSIREVAAPVAPVGMTRLAQRGLATKEEVDDLFFKGQPEKLTSDKEEFLRELVK